MLKQIVEGQTDLVYEYLAAGNPAGTRDERGVSLIEWCAYHGDVSAIKHLLEHGEKLESLGNNYDLNGAAFHGHARLCRFLIEKGADANHPLADTGEAPLHAALCKPASRAHERVVRILLDKGADPNRKTREGVETGCFMRDVRTRGETPLHRAAAFGTEDTIRMLVETGARIDACDMNGDSPLSWASWHLRGDAILRLLCFGEHRIHPERNAADIYRSG